MMSYFVTRSRCMYVDFAFWYGLSGTTGFLWNIHSVFKTLYLILWIFLIKIWKRAFLSIVFFISFLEKCTKSLVKFQITEFVFQQNFCWIKSLINTSVFGWTIITFASCFLYDVIVYILHTSQHSSVPKFVLGLERHLTNELGK